MYFLIFGYTRYSRVQNKRGFTLIYFEEKKYPNIHFSAVKMKNISQHVYFNQHVYFGNLSTYIQLFFVVRCICILSVCQFQLELNKYARL